MPGTKRKRDSSGTKSTKSTRKRSSKRSSTRRRSIVSKLYPADKFARRYVPRTELTAEMYGPNFYDASIDQRQARIRDAYVGRGAYSAGKNWRKFSQGIGLTGLGRSAVGAASNMIAGMGVYTGHGAYTGNSLMDSDGSPEVPVFASAGDETGAVTVTRREYVADIYGPAAGVAFNVQSYSLNPGLEGTFPWLSQIAMNYDEYEMQQCMFTYRSTTTDIGTNTNGQCGSVIMATNYNAGAASFSDKAVMMEYDGAMSCKTTESMIHGVECDPSKLSGGEGHYVRTNPVVTSQDIKSYDHGLFQIAIANSPALFANNAIGELWVSYTVVLRKPKFYSARGLGISRDIYVSGAGTETGPLPLGTDAAILLGQQNNIGCLIQNTANNIKITFPAAYAGFLEIALICENTTAASSAFSSITYTGNATAVNDLYAGGSAAADSPGSSIVTNFALPANGRFMLLTHVKVTPVTSGIDNSVTIVFNAGILTAPSQSQLTITEYNSGFSTRALNFGPIGGQDDAPILVNKQGVVVVPA